MKRIVIFLLLTASLLSAQTTTNLKLKKTARDGAVTWSADLNANLDTIDSAFSGTTSVPAVTTSGVITSTAVSNQVVLGAAAHQVTYSSTAPSAASQTYTFPDAGGSASVMYTNSTNLQNLLANAFVIADPTDTTKAIAFTASGNTTGKTITIASSSANSRTYTLPDAGAADTFAFLAATQTFSGKSFNQNVVPLSAGATDLGSTALPWGNLWLGAAATNNFKFAPAALSAARIITVADPGGAATLAYTNNTTAQVLSGFQSFTGNRAVLTSDFTDANASGLQLITGLAVTPPTGFVGSAAFHCGILFSQATPGASDQFGLAVLTTAPTRVDAGAVVATNVTTTASGPLTNLTTTTPTAIITFTQVASTISPASIDGVAQFAGGGAQPLQFYVTNGTAANVIVVRAGSYCNLL